jgi:hypothetical protein
MRTFIVTCPECDCDLDVDIEDANLADTELGHIVTCADCQTETEYVYDVELDDLVPADEENEEPDDEGALDGLGDDPDDEGEDELA